jgi:hypothetical protein
MSPFRRPGILNARCSRWATCALLALLLAACSGQGTPVPG